MFIPKDIDKVNVSNYMRFSEGVNKFRILDEPITGYVYWLDKNGKPVGKKERAGEGGKPVRVKSFDELSLDLRGCVKGFAAMVIWNYQVKKIQILEVSQVGIMNSLDALANSEDWGDITSFDISINKAKTGPDPMDVEYSVMPSPKKEVSKEVLEGYNATTVNLETLYEGLDPFDTNIKIKDSELDKITEELDEK